MSNLGMRAGTEAARRYEEYRKAKKMPERVLEIHYDPAVRSIMKVLLVILVILVGPLVYLLLDSFGEPEEQAMTFWLARCYCVAMLLIIYMNLKMKRWAIVRTETSIICYGIIFRREITYKELQAGARKRPVKQTEKGLSFATNGRPIKIPTVDMVAGGQEFCYDLCMELKIKHPKLKDKERRRLIRTAGALLLLMPCGFIMMYFSAVNLSNKTLFIDIAAVTGIIAVVIIAVSYIVDRN